MNFAEFLMRVFILAEMIFIVASLLSAIAYPLVVVCWDEGLWRPRAIGSYLSLSM